MHSWIGCKILINKQIPYEILQQAPVIPEDEPVEAERLNCSVQVQWEEAAPGLPCTTLHGHFWNQCYEEDRVCLVMDFDFLQHGRRVQDLAYALRALMPVASGHRLSTKTTKNSPGESFFRAAVYDILRMGIMIVVTEEGEFWIMKKLPLTFGLVLLLSLLLSGIASAHVTVQPTETTQGSYEKFTVRVPSEKAVPTVKVEVKFPLDQVTISRFEPKPGWKYELTKDGDKITGVIWTATGEGLGPTEFGEFYMQGKVADTATEITWKAYQTYKDGSVVEWVGAAGSDKPASVTKVKAKPAGAASDSHGHTAAPAAGDAHAESPASGASNTPLYLSIVAVVLGAVSLLVSLVRKK